MKGKNLVAVLLTTYFYDFLGNTFVFSVTRKKQNQGRSIENIFKSYWFFNELIKDDIWNPLMTVTLCLS